MVRRKGRRYGQAALALGLVLLACLPLLMAGAVALTVVFPAQSEQVVLGMTTGLSGAQSDDGIREQLSETDTATDPSTGPSSETLTAGAIIGGAFPAGVASEDGAFLQYREVLPPSTDHYPSSQTTTTGAGCGGAFPASLQTSDDGPLCLREADTGGAGVIAFDVAGTGTGTGTAFNIAGPNVGTGSDRALVVGIIEGNQNVALTSVTWDSGGTNQVMTRIGWANRASDVRVEMWRLVNPTSGARTLRIVSPSSVTVTVGIAAYTGVDQTTPNDAAAPNSGNGANPTVSVPSASGDLVLDAMGWKEISSTPTAGAGQLLRWNSPDTGDEEGAGSQEAGAATVTMSWSMSSGIQEWATVGASFNPGSAGPNHQLSARHDWSGMPSGADAYDLCVEAFVANAAGESALVEVLTPPATWNTRITVSKTADDNADQCYTLTAPEFNAGAPSVRWIGGTESGDATQSDVNIDHERIVRRYTNYRLDSTHTWSGVPAGNSYVLGVTGYRTDEDMSVQVLTPPATWNTRLAVNAVVNTQFTYTLTPAEYGGGAPEVRFVDGTGVDPTASDLFLDYVAITTVRLTYSLEVLYNVTGVTGGSSPFLVAKGNISAGGENFHVHVWNFTTSAWNVLMSAPFTAANAYHNASLGAGHLSGGTVRIRFVDAAGQDATQWAVSLDLVAVAVVNGQPVLANDGVVPPSGDLSTTFTFSVRYFDAENDAPAFVELTLDGTPYGMSENSPVDTDYVDGKDYFVVRTIGLRGTFDYTFSAGAATGDLLVTSTPLRQVSVLNRPPTIVNPIALDGTHVALPYARDFNGSDLDGDIPVWSVLTNASWLSIGPANGTVWGQAPGAPSSFFVTVTLDDGYGGSDEVNYTVSVGNLAPIITNPIATDGVHAGRPYARDFDGTDPDGDPLTWSIVTNASWLSIGGTNGTVWGLASLSVGTFSVDVQADDGFGGADWSNYILTVGNLGPAITNAIPTITAFRRTPVAYSYTALDPDADTLTWSLRTNASFLAAGPSNGTLYGLTANVPASYWAETTVVDGFGGVDVTNVTLVVVNQSPQVSGVSPRSAFHGLAYSGSATGVDPDDDALTWSLASNASWLGIDPGSGTLTGTASEGVYYVNVTARDPYGGVATGNFTLRVTVRPPSPPPEPGDPYGFLFLLLGAIPLGLFALAAVPRRRQPLLEQAFLLGPDRRVRFEYAAPQAPLDEAALRPLIADVNLRIVAMIRKLPHVLHVVKAPTGYWILVSQSPDAARVAEEAEPLFRQADRDFEGTGPVGAHATDAAD